MSISFSLSICMACFYVFYTSANLYMILINGTSMVCLQLIINVCFAIISLPLHLFVLSFVGSPRSFVDTNRNSCRIDFDWQDSDNENCK